MNEKEQSASPSQMRGCDGPVRGSHASDRQAYLGLVPIAIGIGSYFGSRLRDTIIHFLSC